MKLASQQQEISDLRTIVQQQKDQIEALMATLGLSSTLPLDQRSTHSAVSQVATRPAVTSYSDVTHQPAQLTTSIKQAVVAAVYRDQSERERRARNLIISGLTIDTTGGESSDGSRIASLIRNHLQHDIEVIKCRRLGRLQPGKIQPVLVTLKTADSATAVVRDAKKLRRSGDEYVRRSIFINPDATKAEAYAAYLDRCARRQRATSSQTTDGTIVDSSVHRTSSSVNAPSTTSINMVPVAVGDTFSSSTTQSSHSN